jgi:hypothetical protein
MNTLRMAALCALVAGPALAEEPKADDHVCKVLGMVAGSIMENRQLGIPLSDMLDVTPMPLLRQIVLLAYEKPRYYSDEVVREEIQDFRNDVEVACYRKEMSE